MNILGFKTSPAARALFSQEWKGHKVGVVMHIIANFVKSLFFIAVGVVICAGLSLLLLVLTPDASLTERHLAVTGFVDGLNEVMVNVPLMALTGIVMLFSVVMGALITLHHFYMAAELGYRSLISYQIDRRPEMQLYLKRTQDSARVAPAGPNSGNEKQ
ncbi:hypothetical protein [Serratia fonticola]|uniref:hypothetical protein n=1 Tax=Serratia fonticola TaxID=47917 RepID=UPI00137874B6|nr:hypothetical protein [Serratia fonticola]NCG53648.1 hypothetical protein [Serratia fonticola]